MPFFYLLICFAVNVFRQNSWRKWSTSICLVNDINDLDEATLARLKHFFERYKDLESGKWAKVTGFENKAKAQELIKAAIQ